MLHARSLGPALRLHATVATYAASCLWEWLRYRGHDRPWPS